mmetsp:Transcript_40421/g.29786  ORF Transcript_40421/g.29786 Transcript_40421/m.29786 type:complete len:113 (+) Transcript_40421:461-799(+)
MVMKFEADIWYNVTILINYENQTVTAYVKERDDKPNRKPNIASDIFFTDLTNEDDIQSSNALILYNLTPETTCKIRNLKVCQHRCDGDEELLFTGGSSLGISLVLFTFAMLF